MPSISDLTAAILVGGLGTRLRPIVADRPKVLAEVSGRPFLAYILDQLVDVGIREVVLCTGYMGERVKAELGDSYGKIRLLYSEESKPLGTAGALRLALPLFNSDFVLVTNGDSFCDVNLEDLYAFHCERNAIATLLLAEVSDMKRYGRVCVDDHGRILRFREKSAENGSGCINAGIYVLSRPAVLMRIPRDATVSLEKDVFPRLIGEGFYGYRGKGRFLDIGTPETYSVAESFFTIR